ncbi:hypothetical protein SALWKB12_0750 [Snodgrassella communis]|uniref:Uncharacterized protein n=1 Tax=Snodgrassella communis TaxID=2946699 RepID=A0A837AGL2_9NEIS|nr:hypothetical protein SALWKB12_0750 [Snodgrassella communis]KDN15251.1 hypothetical protein SALWKB29_0877 [Snodgrassella communis]
MVKNSSTEMKLSVIYCLGADSQIFYHRATLSIFQPDNQND